MPYISSERVAEIRKQIKKEFPAFKFSITCRHYSQVVIKILAGPLDFGTTKMNVHRYYIKEHFAGQALEMMNRIHEIANKGNYTVVIDGDYGAVPSFYVDISIGDWDKEYVLTAAKVEEPADSVPVTVPVLYVADKPEPVVNDNQPVKNEAVTDDENIIKMIDYSEKCIVLTGKGTKKIKEKIKEIGGKPNPNLSCGFGWVFSKKRLPQIQNLLSSLTA